MGPTHVTMGLAAGTVTASFLPVSPGVKLAWIAVVTGWAAVPDMDHPSASVSKMWGPITAGYRVRIFGKRRTIIPGSTHIVSMLAGGHRKGTHSMLGLAALLLVAYLAAVHPAASALLLAFVVGVAILGGCILSGTNPRSVWIPNVLLSAAAGWYLVFELGWTLPVWLGPAMALGAFTHIMGDACTEQGVPLSWPLLGVSRFRLMTINTNGPVERYLVLPATWIVAIWWFAWWELHAVPGPHVVAGRVAGALFGSWL